MKLSFKKLALGVILFATILAGFMYTQKEAFVVRKTSTAVSTVAVANSGSGFLMYLFLFCTLFFIGIIFLGMYYGVSIG
jgi:hypothetical protein